MSGQLDPTQVLAGPALDSAAIATWALALVLFRAVPAWTYAVCSTRFDPAYRAALIVLGLASLGLLSHDDRLQLAYLIGGLGYFLLLSMAVVWLGPRMRAVHASPAGTFCLCAGLCVLVPCLVAPVAEANLVWWLGFEMTLSTYSLLTEHALAKRPIEPRDALFFVLVNPTLVWPERGVQVDGEGRTGYAAGGLRLVASAAGLVSSGCLLAVHRDSPLPEALQPAEPLITFAVFALSMCMFHWGGAGIQLACMRLLGWRVPERYDRPWVARDPLEFWSRWNTYVGAWLRRYVFTPHLLAWRRQHRRRSPMLVNAAAVVWTFLIAGGLHDLVEYPTTLTLSARWITAFAIGGSTVALWEGIRQGLSHASQRWTSLAPVLTLVVALGGSAANVAQLLWMHDVLTLDGDVAVEPQDHAVAALTEDVSR